jgi:hypothetical protein
MLCTLLGFAVSLPFVLYGLWYQPVVLVEGVGNSERRFFAGFQAAQRARVCNVTSRHILRQ